MLMSSAASQMSPSKCWWEPRTSQLHLWRRRASPWSKVGREEPLESRAAFLISAFCCCAPVSFHTMFFNPPARTPKLHTRTASPAANLLCRLSFCNPHVLLTGGLVLLMKQTKLSVCFHKRFLQNQSRVYKILSLLLCPNKHYACFIELEISFTLCSHEMKLEMV